MENIARDIFSLVYATYVLQISQFKLCQVKTQIQDIFHVVLTCSKFN